MSATATAPATNTNPAVESKSPTNEEQTRECAYGLTCDLIERDLQSTLDVLFMTLLQIMDSGLIKKEDDFHRCLNSLYEKGERLTSRCFSTYSASNGGANHLHKKCRTLAEEVDLYRQEIFWTKSDTQSVVESEKLIRDIFAYYTEAEFLMRSLQQEQPDYRIEARAGAPKYTRNPYEQMFAE